MLENDFEGEDKEIIKDFLDIYENINYNILGKMLHPTKGGPQGSSLVPMLFCYYIEKAIGNQILNTDNKIQLYADDIIIQTKSLDELSNSYHRIKENLERIDLTINTEKCEIISDDPNDIIKDNTNGQLIMPKKNAKYLGQIINSEGLTENIIENKIFGKLINVLQRYKGFAKTTKIRIFKTYLISKVNHLLPLISLTGNIEISWKCIRKIIFRNILNSSTLPLETAMSMGIGYYNIIIRPLVRLVERYNSFRGNSEETQFIKDATTKAILFWLQTEKKHQDQEKELLQKIASNEIWVNIKDLDNILYKNLEKRLMRNNASTIKINNINILKFPNINYNMSNAPYHEIIDTAIIRESNKSDKEKDIKFERMLELTKQIIIGKEIALLLSDLEKFSRISPDMNKDKDIVEEMIITESLLEQEIENIREKYEEKAIELVKEIIKNVPKLMKEKAEGKVKEIEFKHLRMVHNEYRDIVSKLDKKQARCLDIAHEILEKSLKNNQYQKLKRGRPPKIKEKSSNNQINIEKYFIEKE